MFFALLSYPRIAELTKIWKQANPPNDAALRQKNKIMDLNQLNVPLQKPEFQNRLASKKNPQQQFTINLLRRKGQLVKLPNGGNIVLSSPNMKTSAIPRSLKKKPIELWTEEETNWLNM